MEDLNSILHIVNKSEENLNMKKNTKKSNIMVMGKDISENEPNVLLNKKLTRVSG